MNIKHIAPLVLLLAAAAAQASVTLELLEIDPRAATELPPERALYGRIGYVSDRPVRLSLQPFRDGKRVTDDAISSPSPLYPPGRGEGMQWFAFRAPQYIDEIRAMARDERGAIVAEASLRRELTWLNGARVGAPAAWVAELRAADDALARSAAAAHDSSSGGGWLFVQALFLSVPLALILQVYAWRKLDGTLGRLARYSGYAMGALWLFVIVTALLGSNLSPIWLVFLSPLFVVFLAGLLTVNRLRSPAPA